MSAAKAPQRVAMLYRGARPGVELLALLGDDRAVDVIQAPLELSGAAPPADVVVVHVPAEERRAVCEQVRHHYRGPLIVLLHSADNSHDLPPDRSRTLLTRPFSLQDLAVAVAAATPAEGRSTVAPAIPRPVRSWRTRRLVRVAAILVPAALAFVGAFGLADQSDHCPPSCDELTGTGDLTSSSATTVQAVGVGPETSDPGVGVTGPTTTAPTVDPTTVGGSRTGAPTSVATRISTTTAWSSRVPSPTSPPHSTRPQPSASSTTAPTTTRPRPSTTSTSSTTTTTTTDTSTSAPH